MSDLLMEIWFWGVPLTFVVAMFTTERMEGRVSTGELDLVNCAMIAALWPLCLALFIMFVLAVIVMRLLNREARHD